MKKSKLIQLLKSFSPEEITEFEKFIKSPFFKCKTFVVNYFMQLAKYYPEFKDENVDKKIIFRKLYGERKYNDGLIRRMNSDLINLGEQYITYKSFRETSAFYDTCFLHELRVRKLNDIFEIKANKISNKINSGITDNTSTLHNFFIENQRINFYIKQDDSKTDQSLESGTNSLIAFMLSSLNNKNSCHRIQKKK